MGLDMYLSAKKYVQDWEHQYEDGIIPPDTIAKKAAALIDAEYPVMYIEMSVGYWRKANAIHQWFVRNCQDGEDDCRSSYVSHEQLKELKAACESVIKDHSLAAELLPPQEGFFFGSTDLDEWYFNDLEETIKIIDSITASPNYEDLEFYYRSSW